MKAAQLMANKKHTTFYPIKASRAYHKVVAMNSGKYIHGTCWGIVVIFCWIGPGNGIPNPVGMMYPLLLLGTFPTSQTCGLQFNRLCTILLLLFPLIQNSIVHCWWYLSTHDLPLPNALEVVSNSVARAALVAMGILLVPASRYSPFPIVMHKTLGAFVVVGAIAHASLYLVLWQLEGVRQIFFQRQCWRSSVASSNFVKPCSHCSCVDYTQNLWGLLALNCLVVLGISSLPVVRKHWYRIFYRLHVMTAPVILFSLLLHWNPSLLYLMGGVVFYVGSCFPAFVEDYFRHPVKVLGIQPHIDNCTAVTFQVSGTLPRSGQYVRVNVPELSNVSHPFTVIVNETSTNQAHLVFRSCGHFTQRLSKVLESRIPEMYVSGYYGCGDQLETVRQHDGVVLIAGGIGITAFLSLLSQLRNEPVVLHWICRDPLLIDFIKEKHFDPSLEKSNLKVVVHQTRRRDCENPQDSLVHTASTVQPLPSSNGQPFFPSRYSLQPSCRENMLSVLAFIMIAWIGVIESMYVYSNAMSKHSVIPRIWAPLFVLVWGALVSWIIFEIQDGSPSRNGWTPVATEEEDGCELVPTGTRNSDIDRLATNDEKTNDNAGETRTKIEQRCGRPTMDDLCGCLEQAENPALFLCGPQSLSDDVRRHVQSSSGWCCGRRRLKLYEESFQL